MSFKENRKPSPSDKYEKEFCEYMLQDFQDEMLKILQDPNPNRHFPINVDYLALNSSDCKCVLSDLLLNPDDVLRGCDRGALHALLNVYDNAVDKQNLSMKRNVHVRLECMPTCWDRCMDKFPGCKEAGRYVTLVGSIVRCSIPKLLEFSKFYRCNKCRNIMSFEAPASRCHAFPRTLDKCDNRCVGAKVELYEGDDKGSHFRFRDYQEAKLQEPISQMDFGIMPKALTVILEDDLVDAVKPGDDVIMSGNLFLRWRPFRLHQPLSAEMVFKANYVRVQNEYRTAVTITDELLESFDKFWGLYEHNPFEGRNHILKSFCPEMYGMYTVKLSLFMVLAGGVTKQSPGSTIRGNSHLLLVGDPGTGKSQFLKYASKLCPRSVITNGTGTTSAGLTASAVKDSGDWHLEAGALVLADGGLCCIDEFTNIKEQDRTSIHEAMEQQTISIAKAGIVCKLSTRCTILAATNPKMQKYNSDDDLEVNLGLAGPLLSRFDLVVVLKDGYSESWDEFLSEFILTDKDPYAEVAKKAKKEINLNIGIWPMDRLQSYLVVIKDKKPEMTADVRRVIGKYYQLQRDSATRCKSRTTVRLLESLFRLSEAHAKFMYRECVLLHDAITAISLMEASMQSSAVIAKDTPSALHIAFPKDALQEYYAQAEKILTTLGFPELWATEKVYLETLQKKLPKDDRRSTSPSPGPSYSKTKAKTSQFRVIVPETQYSKRSPENSQDIVANTDDQEFETSLHFPDDTALSQDLFMSQDEAVEESEDPPKKAARFTSTQKDIVDMPPPRSFPSSLISPILKNSSLKRDNVLYTPAIETKKASSSYPSRSQKRVQYEDQLTAEAQPQSIETTPTSAGNTPFPSYPSIPSVPLSEEINPSISSRGSLERFRRVNSSQ